MRASRSLFRLAFVVLVPVVFAWAPSDQQAVASSAATSIQAEPQSCTLFTGGADGRVVVYDTLDFAAGPWDRIRLCVVHHTRDDIYKAGLIWTGGSLHQAIQAFRAAKAAAVDLLTAEGFDLCRIRTWESSPNVGSRDIRPEDLYGLPVECAPRVIATDAGAEAWMPVVQAATDAAVAWTAAEMGWRPRWPLLIAIGTEAEPLLEFTSRALSSDATFVRAWLGREPIHEDGYAAASGYGYAIFVRLLPLAGEPIPDRVAYISAMIAHEYVHYAQAGLTNGNDPPQWFKEGQARYIQGIVARSISSAVSPGDLAEAVLREREGSALPLLRIRSLDAFAQAELQAEFGSPAYSRAYAAYLYLLEKLGFAKTVELLTTAGGPERPFFDTVLRDMLGANPLTMEGPMRNWLLGMRFASAAEPAGRFRVALAQHPTDRRLDDAVVLYTAPIETCDGEVIAPPEISAFAVTAQPDGGFSVSRAANFPNGVFVSLEGRLTENEGMSGTFRYRNEEQGCESVFPFGQP